VRSKVQEHGKQKDHAERRGEGESKSDEHPASEEGDPEERKVIANARDDGERAAGEEGNSFVVGEIGQFV
jgi:hypothetical protein